MTNDQCPMPDDQSLRFAGPCEGRCPARADALRGPMPNNKKHRSSKQENGA
ncbi:hypothetical protein IQ252_19035 [Tychonema sp. LEGE 07203]|nr:hypothetical protein [Tychonema sp. LEGE 07203]